MEFELTAEEQAFQKEVEDFLEANRSPDVMDPNPEQLSQTVETPPKRAFMRKLAEQGWPWHVLAQGVRRTGAQRDL